MFFNRQYIPAVPVREEQRISEEEELARQLKREARIFFPDKKLPDFPVRDLPPLPEEQKRDGETPAEEPGKTAGYRQKDNVSAEDHDAVCREEDSLRRHEDGTISPHEAGAVLQETRLKEEQGSKTSCSRLNKEEIIRGVRLSVVLDRPRGLKPWKEEIF